MCHEMLTTVEVAKRLGASVVTVRKWAREGHIPCMRVGGRFIRLDWEAVVESLKTSNQGRPTSTAHPQPRVPTVPTQSDSPRISKRTSKLVSNLPVGAGAHGD